MTVLGIGGLGAFTTFSSFARDAVALAARPQMVHCVAYIGVTCVAGIAAAAIGMAIA
jgi:CrcB protein